MKSNFLITAVVLGLFAVTLSTPADNGTNTTNAPKAPAAAARPKIYDEAADGSKQIEEALATAKKDGKHVLLQFGANWCIWCHRLHQLFDKDAGVSAELKQNYVVVMIDVNKEHNKATDEKYGHPTSHGLPVLVVLDAAGKQLTTKDSGELEEKDHHSPEKVLTWLKEWAPKK